MDDLVFALQENEDLDVAAPMESVQILADKTGQTPACIVRMTIAGCAPGMLELPPIAVPWPPRIVSQRVV